MPVQITLQEEDWHLVLEAVTHYGYRLAARAERGRAIEAPRLERLRRIAGILGDAVDAPAKKRFR